MSSTNDSSRKVSAKVLSEIVRLVRYAIEDGDRSARLSLLISLGVLAVVVIKLLP
jgi:hypothetical protein